MTNYDPQDLDQAVEQFHDWAGLVTERVIGVKGGGGTLPRLLSKCDPRPMLSEDSSDLERFTAGLRGWADLFDQLGGSGSES